MNSLRQYGEPSFNDRENLIYNPEDNLQEILLNGTLNPALGSMMPMLNKKNNKLTKLREIKLIEALDKQTNLLEDMALNYEQKREQKLKVELKKMKNKLEKLENEQALKEMKLHQTIIASEIAAQNNQFIYGHISKTFFYRQFQFFRCRSTNESSTNVEYGSTNDTRIITVRKTF